MQKLYQSPRLSAFASVKNEDVLVIGTSFHAKPEPGHGQLAQLNERYDFSFSFVDLACVLSFPYPHEEVAEILATIQTFAKSFRRVITFGSSVGGFVAMNFASRWGAQSAIVASPPFSFNPEKMPSEKRWQALRAPVTDFRWDNVANSLADLREVYLLYDPRSPDMPHVKCIEQAARKTVHLRVPFSGHPSFGVLNQGRTLGRLVEAIAAERFEMEEYRAALRESRPASSIYLKNLAAAQPNRRDALRVRLLEKAHKLDGDTGTVLSMLPPLVRLGRMRDVQALAKSVADAEAVHKRQKKELREKYEVLQERVEDLQLQLKKARKRAAAG